MKKSTVVIAALIAIIGLSSNFTYSQQKEQTKKAGDTLYYSMEDVVVTGTRTAKKIIDVPYPVISIGSSEFKFERKNEIDDAVKNVPGVLFQSRYGNHDVKVSIRGFGSRSLSGIRGVRMLIDGIPESEPDGQSRIEALDLNTIGSIEIVKGNSSSLYASAPGGVINFSTDLNFNSPFVQTHSEFGSWGLQRNGAKIGVVTKDYKFLLNYTYHYYEGYRAHSSDYWNIINSVFEMAPSTLSSLQVLAYWVEGTIRLPGSLTRAEYDSDAMIAAPNEKNYDFKRGTKKGRLGLRFVSWLDNSKHNQIELTGYAGLKYFERLNKSFRFMNRTVFGASAKFLNNNDLFGHSNEFTIGLDLFSQTGPIESYKNIGGTKSDVMNGMTNEAISNTGVYAQNIVTIVPEKMSLLLSGRYEKITFDSKDQLNGSQSAMRTFENFAPKVALNYKLTPSIAAYTSFGIAYDVAAYNEMDNYPYSSNTSTMLNPDLNPQKSQNFEVGIKGGVETGFKSLLTNVVWEASFFNYAIKDEIVPFIVDGGVFYRNSAKTTRTGLELGATATLMHGLTMKVAYTYSNFTYDEYNSISLNAVPGGSYATKVVDYSGKVVPSVPKHNIGLGLNYERYLATNLLGFVGADMNYLSEMYVNDANTDQTEAYTLMNASLGCELQVSKIKITATAGINNIADTKYVGFININDGGGRFFEVGAPRNFFGSINLGYNF